MTHLSRALAAGVFALAASELAAAVAAALASETTFAAAVGSFTVTNGAMGLGFALCGVLLAWHRPRNPMGWLFLAAGVADTTSASAAQLLIVTAGHGWDETANHRALAPHPSLPPHFRGGSGFYGGFGQPQLPKSSAKEKYSVIL
jgi:hypothetical protein